MKQYQLMNENGELYLSTEPGLFGGYRKKKIYGRLDCQSANQAIVKGGYVKHRVFFQDEETAIKAGYRPCAKCMPEKYAQWKRNRADEKSAADRDDQK